MNLAHIRLALRARRHRRRGDPELRLLPRLVDGARASLDIGANKGVYTYWLARLSRSVVAFEPNAELCAGLAAARLPNLDCRAHALSDQDGEAWLDIPPHPRGGLNHPSARVTWDGSADGSAAAGGVKRRVALRRLDDLGLGDFGFIKIDVEGHEERVLAGGERSILASRPVMLMELEERHTPGCLERVCERFGAEGYRCRFVDGGRLLEIERLGEGQRAPSGRYICNFLFLPKERSEP